MQRKTIREIVQQHSSTVVASISPMHYTAHDQHFDLLLTDWCCIYHRYYSVSVLCQEIQGQRQHRSTAPPARAQTNAWSPQKECEKSRKKERGGFDTRTLQTAALAIIAACSQSQLFVWDAKKKKAMFVLGILHFLFTSSGHTHSLT